MFEFVGAAVLSFLLPGSASSFVVPAGSRSHLPASHSYSHSLAQHARFVTSYCYCCTATQRRPAHAPPLHSDCCSWSPQDLTADNDGYVPIPDDDYIKQYQRNPEQLWPVEFFVIAYRRQSHRRTAEILVRRSANGTSKYGLGSGVPATRWVPSTQHHAPLGYQFSDPTVTFDASNYPEFPKEGSPESWTYRKIDICENAFKKPDGKVELQDSELAEYASKVRDALRKRISDLLNNDQSTNMSTWEATRLSVVQNILEQPNSVAAIQGTLRMSGLFERRDGKEADGRRFISLDEPGATPDPSELANSMRIYTMFPQMPDPMPLPSTSAEELQEEIASRPSRMAQSGRNPHQDQHGRTYTHISTSNVSNTIHGIYLILDVSDLSGLDDVPALDLFGTKRIEREWVSLEDLLVVNDDDGDAEAGSRSSRDAAAATSIIGTEDTKPTFISGFIVRQLIKEEVIDVYSTVPAAAENSN